MERTYTMIKPECVERNQVGAIVDRIEKGGFKILAMRMVSLSKKDAEAFYAVHKERPFYNDLTDYMSSGPVVAMALEKDNCVKAFREFIGATNPAEAAEGTIRKDFGTNIENNAIHASDSVENGEIEINFFFGGRELL
ncbi:MAG: nucleoside-diphosphate kinase [Calditrichota bacterium]